MNFEEKWIKVDVILVCSSFLGIIRVSDCLALPFVFGAAFGGVLSVLCYLGAGYRADGAAFGRLEAHLPLQGGSAHFDLEHPFQLADLLFVPSSSSQQWLRVCHGSRDFSYRDPRLVCSGFLWLAGRWCVVLFLMTV